MGANKSRREVEEKNSDPTPPAPEKVRLKILTLGDAGCGKTSLIQRFVHREFQLEYAATVGMDLTSVDSKLGDGTIASVQIWDTAGQERFRHLTQNYYRGCHGVVMVYDITSTESFRHIFEWIRELQQASGEGKFEIIVLGNKIDLNSEREVEKLRGELMAKEIKARFFECSALSGYNVDEAFNWIIQEAGNSLVQSEHKREANAASNFQLKVADEKWTEEERSACCGNSVRRGRGKRETNI